MTIELLKNKAPYK